MSGNVKKVLDFLLFRSVFSSRNLTSLFLVGLFFLVYWLSGGKLSTLPSVTPGNSFGGLDPTGDDFQIKGDVDKRKTDVRQGSGDLLKLFDRASRNEAPRRAAGEGASDGADTAPEESRKRPSTNVDDRLSEIEKRLKDMEEPGKERAQ